MNDPAAEGLGSVIFARLDEVTEVPIASRTLNSRDQGGSRGLVSKEIDVFAVPYFSLVMIVVLAGVAGIVAAIPPSRRAAKLNVLKAVVSE